MASPPSYVTSPMYATVRGRKPIWFESTIDIIDRIKTLMPSIQAGLPPELKIKTLDDQSLFVRAAVSGVVREGIIAAALTGLMILLFLGSWHSTLIITISIPLSVLVAIICLSALGETI